MGYRFLLHFDSDRLQFASVTVISENKIREQLQSAAD